MTVDREFQLLRPLPLVSLAPCLSWVNNRFDNRAHLSHPNRQYHDEFFMKKTKKQWKKPAVKSVSLSCECTAYAEAV